MRKIQQTYRYTPIRFRQWSRKGYAIFASLSICTTIGRLRKNVTECALLKQAPATPAVSIEYSTEEISKQETDTAPTSDLLQELLALLLPQATILPACQSGQAEHNQTYKKSDTSPKYLGGVEPRPYMQTKACRGGVLLRPKCYNNPQLL